MPDLLRPRPLTLQDLPGLMVVQRACYGDDFIESAEIYARRLASPVQCSLVLEHAGHVCAYLAAYDAARGNVTPLHGMFHGAGGTAHPPDTLYLHDMAVLPERAGQGLAQALLRSIEASAMARGLAHSALVAVQGSQGFWERQGYAVQALEDAHPCQQLAAYGAGAVYMVRTLG